MAMLRASSRTLLQLSSKSSVRLLATKSRPPHAPKQPPSTPPASSSSSAAPPPPPPERTEFKAPAKPSPAVTSEPPPAETPTLELNRSLLPSLDFDPASAAGGAGGRTGAKSSVNSPSTIERRRKIMFRFTSALVAAGLVGGWVYMGREWEEGEAAQKRDSELAGFGNDFLGRSNARIGDLLDYFNKPLSKEILPQPQHKPYTLLLSLDDLLITSTWDRQNGWRTAKRPGVDYFIAYLSQFYEVVLFTSQQSFTAAPIAEQLDPYGQFIMYRLFREYTRSFKGKIVKDLAYLNRDLSKVILIDTHPEHTSAQPENAILLPKWKGDPRDTGLVGLIPFLESIGIMHPEDVRPILKAYEGKDIASTFAAIEAESKRRAIEQWQKKRGDRAAPATGAVGRASFGSLFGGGSPATSMDPSRPPPTYLEIKRKEAQEYYRREQQWLKENEAELKKMIEQDKAAQMADMGGSLLGALTGGAFKASQDAEAAAAAAGATPAPASTPK